MATHFVFADEAGCFKFEAGAHASRYFILCTLRMETCYKYAWYYHAKDLLPRRFNADDTVLISAAALDTAKGKAAFRNAFNDVVQQTGGHLQHSTVFHLAKTDPCLQAADYCAWALQRKWERGDGRSYDLIADKITSEFDMWKHSKTLHY